MAAYSSQMGGRIPFICTAITSFPQHTRLLGVAFRCLMSLSTHSETYSTQIFQTAGMVDTVAETIWRTEDETVMAEGLGLLLSVALRKTEYAAAVLASRVCAMSVVM